MEFHEKLQELRRRKGLTQEELAAALYVSRTAVSKWESGRGYPSIDSLKAIAGYYSVTIDELLSGDELLSIAQEDRRQRETRVRDWVFGGLDVSVILFVFLPLFGQASGGVISCVPLLSLTGIAPYLKAAYAVSVIGMMASGILLLALRGNRPMFWTRNKSRISMALNVLGALLFIISSQPYAAALLFMYLVIKASMLLKMR